MQMHIYRGKIMMNSPSVHAFVCVCVCVYIYIYIHTYIHTSHSHPQHSSCSQPYFLSAYSQHLYTFTHTNTYIHTYIHTYTPLIRIPSIRLARNHAFFFHTHNAYIHKHTNTDMHTYTHTSHSRPQHSSCS